MPFKRIKPKVRKFVVLIDCRECLHYGTKIVPGHEGWVPYLGRYAWIRAIKVGHCIIRNITIKTLNRRCKKFISAKRLPLEHFFNLIGN